MSRRWKTLVLCVSVLLASAGCDARPEAAPRGFVPRYEEPAPADAAHARFLRERRLPERTADALNAYLDLPYEVTVLARSCAGEGSGYDPDTRRIELCYDDLTEERELVTTDEEVADVMTETLYHEAGHALVDALDLPAGGDRAEEDAADRFAALMLIREGPDGERGLRTAAEAYARTPPDPGADRDEHAPPAARAAAHLCLLHGAAPERHPDLADRTRGCTPTWPQARDAWTHDLRPLLR
ncbi:DUF4344 domain-containing metallopeptidase [Streptomyces sp. NPDC051366]|uniref:DUF4344 domain-containing metallopeptidase n=1 Tax=Streptomyces sp. NPDC051366 TaxID=3365652 RepID=UPI00379AB0DF